MCGSLRKSILILCLSALIPSCSAHANWWKCFGNSLRIIGEDEANLLSTFEALGVKFVYSGEGDRLAEMTHALANALYEKNIAPEYIIRRYTKNYAELDKVFVAQLTAMQEKEYKLAWSFSATSYRNTKGVAVTPALFGNRLHEVKLMVVLEHELRHKDFSVAEFPKLPGETFEQYYDRHLPTLEEDERNAIHAEIAMAKKIAKLGFGKTSDLIVTSAARKIYAIQDKNFVAGEYGREREEKRIIRNVGEMTYYLEWKKLLQATWDAQPAI